MADISNISKSIRNRVKNSIRRLEESDFNLNRKPISPTVTPSYTYNPRANRVLDAVKQAPLRPFAEIERLAGNPRTGRVGQVNSLNGDWGALNVYKPIEKGLKTSIRPWFRRGANQLQDTRPELSQRIQASSDAVLGKEQSLGRSTADILGMGATAVGLANPTQMVGYTGLGTLIRGAGQKWQGGKFTDNLGSNISQSFAEAAPMAGISTFTNPLIAGATGKLMPLAANAPKAAKALNYAAKLPIRSGMNMAEGVVMDKAAGFDTTKESLLIDAIAPAGFDLGSGSLKTLKKAFEAADLKLFRKAIKNQKVPESVVKQSEEYITKKKQYRDKFGKYAKEPTKPEPKVKEEMRQMPDGSLRLFRNGKMETFRGDSFKQMPDGSVQSLAGGVAGVEYEYEKDENGNIVGVKYKGYDPVKGAIGVGAMAGYTKIKGNKQLSNEAENLVKQEVDRLKAQVGGVDIIKTGEDATGGGYRASANPDWYKSFFKEYGRKPSEKQFRELAIENLKTGNVDGFFDNPEVLKYNRAALEGKTYNEGVPVTAKEATQQSKGTLKGMNNYYNDMIQSGVPKEVADRTSYKQFREGKLSNVLDNVPEVADNNIKGTKRAKVVQTDFPTPSGPINIDTKTGFRAELNKIFNPIKNAPKEVQKEVSDWSSRVLTGRAKASEVVSRFGGIDEKDGWKFIQKFQDPKAKVDLGGKYSKEMEDLRNYYDSIRQEGIRRGLDINYLDNYLNQVWKNTPEEVDKALAEYMKKGKSLGKNPSFTKQRRFNTYAEGRAYGLVPKYTHPSQLAAHYRYQLEKATANRDLINNLKRLGAVLPADEAPAGWKLLDTQLVPDIDGFRAEPSVAKSLNNMLSLDKGNVFLRAGANTSRALQEVSLSGGVPATPLNAFTLANMVKEVTAGKLKSPVSSFVISMSDKHTKDYFKKNAKYTTMMAQEGIRSRSIIDYDKAYKNLLDYEGPKKVSSGVADLWNTALQKPTFERFMPMLELNTFKETYDRAIKNGLTSKEAQKLAGKTTKAWHGVADKLSRSTDVDNTLSAVFFAPTFRESMINFWGANAKAMNPKNWNNPTYKYNKQFLGGMLATYVLYNLVNKELTGHYMHENKDGKELAIEIPRENGRSWFIPLLPSIGTVPRRGFEIAGALSGGDVRTATQKFGSFFSQPINVGGSLLSNRTFYGGPIYSKDDTTRQRFGKLAGYGAEQLAHPFIGEPIAVAQGRKTPVEGLMGAMELPIYPSKSSSTTGEQPTRLGKLFGNNKVSASSEEQVNLPTTTKELSVLYEDTERTINNYNDKKTDILYNPEYDQATKDKKLQELQDKMDIAIQFKKQIESERPEQIFDIGVMTYGKGGGQSSENRGEWVIKQLEAVGDDDEKLKEVVNKLYEGKVLTKSVVEYLNEQGFNITKYNYGTGYRYIGGGGSGKSKKPTAVLKGVKNTVNVGKLNTSPYYSKNPFRLSTRKSPTITIGSLTTPTRNVIPANELKALATPDTNLIPYS